VLVASLATLVASSLNTLFPSLITKRKEKKGSLGEKGTENI